jgi:guanylate kinase
MTLGPLIILSGPSGSGKSTLIRRLLESSPELPLRQSVSATSRRPRPGERDGLDYYFWTREQFEEKRQSEAFLESADVYGNYYGTLKSEVEPHRQQGTGVILDIDTQGAEQVKRLCPEVVRVLLRASSMAAYEDRLRKRETEDEESIQRRLAGAQREIDRAAGYEYTVINDDLDKAVADFRVIIQRLFPRDNDHAR